jgi:hypothetical protein
MSSIQSRKYYRICSCWREQTYTIQSINTFTESTRQGSSMPPDALNPSSSSFGANYLRVHSWVQIDPVGIRHQYNHQYKWILNVTDHFSKNAFLCPLEANKQKRQRIIFRSLSVHSDLEKRFSGDNGREIKGTLLVLLRAESLLCRCIVRSNFSRSRSKFNRNRSRSTA